jgi:hypothetical protein
MCLLVDIVQKAYEAFGTTACTQRCASVGCTVAGTSIIDTQNAQ